MPSYCLELKLKVKKDSDRNYLQNYFNAVAKLGNEIRRFAIRQLGHLKQDRNYNSLLAEYVKVKGDEDSPERERLSKELSVIVGSYGLTKYGLQKSACEMRKHLKYVHSDVYQKLSDSIWRSVEKYLYGNGKQIHFKKWDDVMSFENKKNSTGIIYADGKVYINCTPKRPKCGIVLDIILPRNKESAHYMYETTCLTDRTKYCRIVRKMFPSGWRYYVQLVQEGIPPQKHETGKGRVGIDIGTSTIAAVSKDGCILEELGEPASSPAEECLLQRKLDRSRRAMNPNNYKEDGSVKKGKKTWKKSKTYQAVQNRLKSLRRQKAARLKQWQEAEANKIAAMGNKVFVETIDFKALQKRAKNTERQEQTSIVKQKDGTEKKVHKYKKKKRFGGSIGMHAPAQFLSILERKLSYHKGGLYRINTWKFKASQYNHVDDSYEKKKLSKRYNTIDGRWVQRDLYSAFLLMCSDDTLEHADRKRCTRNYKCFLKNHDACVNTILADIKKNQKKVPSCFGINKKMAAL
ncbi:MAG: hypothetical protein SPL82_10120 [Lachnospiraceae bacterium]|nr:hypothetical protein [Lachnospiraceae bacterium]